ncbi:RNA polymerase sigma-70 factor, partial [Xanthovirga aplysinae]|uniref:RNA polymerase sigma-70 factor n=1 Tax=Xanthovirga aplysinae TaxID=2529853 RepID=UPI0012BD4CFF
HLANGILKDKSLAEEQVQDVFLKMWENRLSLNDEISIFPYLVTSVRNKCYDLIRHDKVKQKYIDHVQKSYQDQILNYDYTDLTDEIIHDLTQSVEQLPEKCKQVFKLSRFDELSHKEIAHRLKISPKTVENQISKALRFLRNALKKYSKELP